MKVLLVQRDNAVYSCPWANGSSEKSMPSLSHVWPWAFISHGEGYTDRELEPNKANPIGALVFILGSDAGDSNSYPLIRATNCFGFYLSEFALYSELVYLL